MGVQANSFFSLLASLIGIYNFMIFIRIMLSWRYSGKALDPNNSIQRIYLSLCKFTDPYLNAFKKIKGLKRGMLDFSPVVALVLLSILQSIFKLLSYQQAISIKSILGIIISTLWTSVFSWILLILIVVLGIRLYFESRPSSASSGFVNMIDKMFNGMMFKVYKTFYKGKMISDRKLIQTALVLVAIIYLILRILVAFLVGVLM